MTRTADVALSAGDLRHRWEILNVNPGAASDGKGGRTNTAPTVALTVSGTDVVEQKPEVWETEQVRGVAAHKLAIRWSPEVDAIDLVKKRIRHVESGRTFEILAKRNRAIRDFVVELTCTEVPFDG